MKNTIVVTTFLNKLSSNTSIRSTARTSLVSLLSEFPLVPLGVQAARLCHASIFDTTMALVAVETHFLHPTCPSFAGFEGTRSEDEGLEGFRINDWGFESFYIRALRHCASGLAAWCMALHKEAEEALVRVFFRNPEVLKAG